MSLVITSNQAIENGPQQSNAFKPFSYQNRLLNTMKIPPRSEIALQSAKINKNGLFVLDRSNSGFNHYFGTPVEDVHSEDINDTTTQPFRAVIGSGEAFRAGDVKNEVNIEDMANEIQKGINQATFHPSLINGVDSTTVAVSADYSTSEDFEGFKFVATQATAKTSKTVFTDTALTDISSSGFNGTFTQAAGEATSTNGAGFLVQNREYPISQNQGTCVINFSDANTSGRWMAGLSRINRKVETELGKTEFVPEYFEYGVRGTSTTGIRLRNQFRYADICICRVGDNLRVFQSGSRTIGSGNGIYMNEVIYYGSHNTNFADIYDLSRNNAGAAPPLPAGKKYRKVKFTLNNEELSIHMIRDDDTEDLLCDFTTMRGTTSGTAANKNECLNPVNAAKWAMYPMMAASGGGGVGGQKMKIEKLDHYTNYPAYDASTYFNYDWWGWSQKYNQLNFCRSLEKRAWNNYSRTTTNHGDGASGLLTPKKVNADGGMTDYDSLIITARSKEYGPPTDFTNTQFTLGYVGQPVSIPTASTNVATTNESSTVPKLISNISLFIRLNNFTQSSMNARMGTLSKIVAHLPRFDNSGNETGGLYFEPHEKTYVALNNTEPLYINSFDVDIVYENETLCTALSGKTIICFHIRQQK
tara:strand:+ start:6775 stop:8703 length:1929 start_codon:yes stop_codon:yes gene_type:complete